MILKNEKIEENKVRFEIEVSAERFAEGMNTAYEKVAPQIALPGFRKGKAPRKMIEKTYGVAVFYEEMMNAVIPVSFREALEETNAQIVSDPEYDIVTLEEGQPFVFSVEFYVKPEFKLPAYKGIEAKKADAEEVTDAQIDAILQRAAEENARQINVTDRAAQMGDIVTIDYAGYFGDEAFEGGTATNHDLELGSGSFIPGFEDQLVGVGLNEEKTVIVSFPEEYHHADYAGKEARFEVAVHKITAKEIPAIDDEFIKDISEFDTVDAYRADQMDKLTKAAEERAAAERENNVIEALIEATEINIPECMIEEEIDGRVQNFSYQLANSGMNLDIYLQYLGQTKEQFRENFREQAGKQVKANLILSKIVEEENIEIADADMESYYDEMSERYKIERERVVEISKGNLEGIQFEMKLKKAVEILVENAVFVEKEEAAEEASDAE